MSRELARVAAVILHYGDCRLTRRLHEQLLPEAQVAAMPVLVLDNAALEPYPAAWRRLPENRFWAGAFDFAVRAAQDLDCSHLWFLNNDIVFTSRPPYLGRALGRLARIEASLGGVGCFSPAFEASPYHPQMVARPGGDFRLVRVMDGVAPLVSLSALEAVGGLDAADNPRGYGVDVWLAVRLHRAGFRLVVDHGLTVRHRHHTAAREVPGFMEAAVQAEAAYLSARLGPDYRERVAAWQGETVEAENL